jgi:hypothetical protein
MASATVSPRPAKWFTLARPARTIKWAIAFCYGRSAVFSNGCRRRVAARIRIDGRALVLKDIDHRDRNSLRVDAAMTVRDLHGHVVDIVTARVGRCFSGRIGGGSAICLANYLLVPGEAGKFQHQPPVSSHGLYAIRVPHAGEKFQDSPLQKPTARASRLNTHTSRPRGNSEITGRRIMRWWQSSICSSSIQCAPGSFGFQVNRNPSCSFATKVILPLGV